MTVKMNGAPVIEFSLAEPGQGVTRDSEAWRTRLPAEGNPDSAGGRLENTVGDYFRAAASFLRLGDYDSIKNAVQHILGQAVSTPDIETINICLVKHGRFYHPSKVYVDLKNGRKIFMALNMAFSPEGKACVERECRALGTLSRRTDALPKVYGHLSLGQVDGIDYSAFSAEWFDNYHEFHLSHDQDGNQRIVVWDSDKTPGFLIHDEAYALYRKAARIMTACYNPVTCEQIQPWHHAAGDFVVNCSGGNVDVRLITVRQYTSIFQETPDSDDWDTLSDAAVLFLIGLTIRMRLDRLDGVGETAWADHSAVQATVQGFVDGLCSGNQALKTMILEALIRLSLEDILEYVRMITGACNPLSPDLPVIEKHIENHGAELHQAIARCLG